MKATRAMILALVVAVSTAMSAGCVVGAQHHRMVGTADYADGRADAEGTIDSVDLGVVADFRYARVGLPFQGQRRQIDIVPTEGAGSGFGVDQVVELRSLQVDVPLWSFRDFSEEPSGSRYPGTMRRRNSLELWASATVGITPIHPASASVGLVYYRYGAVAVRLYGGVASHPFDGVDRRIVDGSAHNRMVEGRAVAMAGGLEVTLAAGEYALELVQFILDLDDRSRRSTDRWD